MSGRNYYDALGRWLEVAAGKAAQLVRITEHDEANRYTARPISFDASGGTETVGTETLTVTNLAEPADAGGQVQADTDAVAIDVGGRWVVFLRPVGSAIFPRENYGFAGIGRLYHPRTNCNRSGDISGRRRRYEPYRP